MAWHLLPWKVPSFPSFVPGSSRDLVWEYQVWVSGSSREKRGRGIREGGKNLHILMWTSPWSYAVRTITAPECLKRVWFPIHDYSMNTLTTGKNSAFVFINGEIILRLSLFLGFICGVSLKSDKKVLQVVQNFFKPLLHS